MGDDENLLKQLSPEDYERLKPYFRNEDEKLMDKVEKDIIEYMQSMRMESGPRTIEEVLTKVTKSSVSRLKKWIWDDKADMVKDPMFYHYVSEYMLYAAKCGWYEYYTEADKEELLPIEKIEKGKGRTFIYQGSYQWFIDSVFIGGLNDKLKNTPICSAGWTPCGGGVADIVSEAYERFGADFITVKGDAHKLDFSQYIKDVERRQRQQMRLYRGSDFGRMKIWESYERQKFKYVKLSCGCVVKIGPEHAIQSSGIFDTTDGNSWRHFRIFIYTAYKCGARNIREILENSIIKICSDDHLFVFNNQWPPAHALRDYNVRSKYYAEGGMLLKKSDDLVLDSSFEGQKWAGITISDSGNHVYDKEKVLASANYKNIVGLNSQQYYEKLLSLQLLMANDTDTYKSLDEFIHLLYPNKPRLLRDKALQWFTGYEGKLQGDEYPMNREVLRAGMAAILHDPTCGPRWHTYDERGLVQYGPVPQEEEPVEDVFQLLHANGRPFFFASFSDSIRYSFYYCRFLSGIVRYILLKAHKKQMLTEVELVEMQEQMDWANEHWTFNWMVEDFSDTQTEDGFVSWPEAEALVLRLMSWYAMFQKDFLLHTFGSRLLMQHEGPVFPYETMKQHYFPFITGEGPFPMVNYRFVAYYMTVESPPIELQGFEQPIECGWTVMEQKLPDSGPVEKKNGLLKNNKIEHYDTCLGRTPCMCLFRPVATQNEEGIKIDEMAQKGKGKGKSAAKAAKNAANQAKKAEKEVKKLEKKVDRETQQLSQLVHRSWTNPVKNGERKLKIARVRGQRFNPYMHCLLDPAAYPAKYPDKFCEESATWVFSIEQEIPVSIAASPNGEFYGVVYPSMRDTLLLRNVAFDDQTGLPNFTGQYDYELEDKSSKHTYRQNQRLNFDEAMWKSTSETCMPFVNNGSADDPDYDTTTFDLTLHPVASTPDFGSKNDEILLENASGDWGIYLNDDASPPTHAKIAGASQVGVTSQVVNAAATKAWFTYESNINTVVKIKRMKLSMYFPQKAGSRRGIFYNNKSIETAVKIADAYRVVGQTLLVSYVGDVTKEGGRIFGYFYNGVTELTENHLELASKIATRKGAFSGPLRNGMWMHWKPCKELDMQFRDPDASLPSNIPIMIFAGTCQEPGTKIRVRVVTCYEYLSNEDVASTSKSPVKPEQITESERILRAFPQIMENPIHVQAVRDFFSRVSNRLRGMWDEYSPYVKTGLSIAQAAAPLLMA